MIKLAEAFQAAISLHQQGRLPEAERLYRAVLDLDHDHFDALHHLGLLCAQRGDLDAAAGLLGKALDQNPKSAEAHNNLGTMLQALGRQEEAARCFETALTLTPTYADARYNLANTFRALGRPEEAIPHYEAALAIDPDFVEAHNNFGNALQMLNRHRPAIAHYERALALRPDFVTALNNLGNSLQALDRHEEALARYDRALALRPDHAGTHGNRGEVLKEIGRVEEARRAIETAINLSPRSTNLYLALAGTKRFAAGDPHLAAMEALARDTASLSREAQIPLHFALGKAFADFGQHERSVSHLTEGNALKRQAIVYDEAATLALVERIGAVFGPALMRTMRGQGDRSSVPIFIIGMPRSGTTLVEQILASHPQVFGAGERPDFDEAAAALGAFPDAIPTLAEADIRELGARYLAGLQALAPAAARITDKMPSNFLFAGLIHLALPNARLIHIRRDPLDTCFSCFSTLFTTEQGYTYDLGELGRYYRAYEALMAHWRAVLPEGAMIEVQYEAVVGDVDGQARRLVAQCGLEWDDACLAFHKTQRPVRTASAAQVRQPIYATSIGRWRPYKAMLGPLIHLLGDQRKTAGVAADRPPILP